MAEKGPGALGKGSWLPPFMFSFRIHSPFTVTPGLSGGSSLCSIPSMPPLLPPDLKLTITGPHLPIWSSSQLRSLTLQLFCRQTRWACVPQMFLVLIHPHTFAHTAPPLPARLGHNLPSSFKTQPKCHHHEAFPGFSNFSGPWALGNFVPTFRLCQSPLGPIFPSLNLLEGSAVIIFPL